ncbi:MAG: PfkB family carbohydrate kinase [Candidatus Kapabacteria bacterium]|nr:PfkB family carbohydrate kinase [Candidatus Kapabacteria bacterium]
MTDINKTRALEILNNCNGKKVAVIGDVMLDRFYWGSVSRISPEAPVPVIDLERESYHLGGSANVANNLKRLGVDPLVCGIIGIDDSGYQFKSIAESLGLNLCGLFIDDKRPTTVKTRIIGNNQQIARLDKETKANVRMVAEDFFTNIIKNTEELSAIIFEDYNKGVISKTLITKVLDIAKNRSLPVLVDPKFDNFFDYKGITVFKPNKKEASRALGVPMDTEAEIISAGKLLIEKLGCQNLMLTLGERGMMLFEADGNISSIPTHARKVADVSGAGDTAIATLTAMICGGANIKEAIKLANIASGIVCEVPGVVPISISELLENISD